ncbi:hypothetical protein FHR32_002618 [Streptosporangium album]|uniref:Uncharacterized protein n=1 Tax=Streptosporangium album TaxID=47479 RepID=A0A7W7RU93_9ACTN|nr:hypothetical protein [Streptosporangium album]MBB4938313.1 hypothetical protein [Streptosporangium album]
MNNDRSEAELVRALNRAADTAPGPDGDLLTAIGGRRRRRVRRRAQSALAVVGVMAVIGGGTAVARGSFSHRGGEGAALAKVTATQSSAGENTRKAEKLKVDIRPAAEVWPSAVSTIPAKAADGWKYRPITGLSATELLLSAESSFEKAGRLESYDTVTGKSTVLADMPAPEGVKGYFAQDVEVGAESIAWWGETPNNSDKWADFWVVPRAGGTARQIGQVTGDLADVERIGVTADSVVWSVGGGGIHRIPLNGGTPEQIEGTDGLHLLSWPWAVDVAQGRGGEDQDKNQTKLVNLETGQTAEVHVPDGTQGLRCGPAWCFGGGVVQRVDGSERKPMPPELYTGGMGTTSLAGGFGFFSVPGVVGRDARGEEVEDGDAPLAAVYDPATGTTAGVGKRDRSGGGSIGTGVSSSPPSIIYWDEDQRQVQECKMVDAASAPRPSGEPTPTGKTEMCSTTQKGGGKKFTVVNLLAVPPAE